MCVMTRTYLHCTCVLSRFSKILHQALFQESLSMLSHANHKIQCRIPQRSLHIFKRRAAFARRPSEPHCEAWSPNEQPFAFPGPGRWRNPEIQDGYVARFSPELDLLARACTEFPGRLRAAKLIMQPSAPAMSEVWGTTTVTFILI